jgi:flagellar basal body L-ring protein FlgH
MNRRVFCYLLLPLVVACKKQSTVTASNLPAPDTAITNNAYPLVTAASSIFLDTGTVYRLGLAQYASFFKFDRSIKNGDLYYEAIQESTEQFKPLKFFILRNGTGAIVAVMSPSKAEVESFNAAWHR